MRPWTPGGSARRAVSERVTEKKGVRDAGAWRGAAPQHRRRGAPDGGRGIRAREPDRSGPRPASLRQPLPGVRRRARRPRPLRDRPHRHRVAGHLHPLPSRERGHAERVPRERPAHQPAARPGAGPVRALRLPVQQRAVGRRLPAGRGRRARGQRLHGAVLLRRRRRGPGGVRAAGPATRVRRAGLPGRSRPRAGHLPRTPAEDHPVPRRLRRHARRDGRRGAAGEAQARAAGGERGALPQALRQRGRGAHGVPRGAGPGRRGRGRRGRRREPHPGRAHEGHARSAHRQQAQ